MPSSPSTTQRIVASSAISGKVVRRAAVRQTLFEARRVLRGFGNMSAASVLFVPNGYGTARER